MTIFFKKDDFFFQLFPDLKGVKKEADLIKAIQNKYAVDGYTPNVVSNNSIVVLRHFW